MVVTDIDSEKGTLDSLERLERSSESSFNKSTDDEGPLNWRFISKCLYTFIVVGMTTVVCFSSSVLTPAIDVIAEELGTTTLMSTLGSTTFLLGSGFGPFIFSPLSELWGRNPIYYTTYLAFTLSNLGCTLSPNIALFLVFRFVSGLFGSPTLPNSGGTLTDLWAPTERSVPFALFTAASVCGPVLGPVIGGILTQYASWRWNFYVVMAVAVVFYISAVAFLPETYGPKLRQNKLARQGKMTKPLKDPKLTHTSEKRPFINEMLSKPFTQSLLRPWIMLFTEPLLLALSLYLGFINGVLFLDFTAYGVVFKDTRGWSTGTTGLSFLGIGAGMVFATCLSPLIDRIHAKCIIKIGPVPEARLPHLIAVTWVLPLALFWFGWTSMPPTHWIWPILAGVPFGFGLVILFSGLNSYITDCYGRFSTSALAANSLMPALFGAGFAIFGGAMYNKLGAPWASSLLGFIALGMACFPPLLYVYGKKLRAASKFHLSAMEIEA